jgi:cytosine deaminase
MTHPIPDAGAFWLRDARVAACFLSDAVAPADREGLVRCDLRIASGAIDAVAPAGSAPDGVDLRGGQVWPGFVDGHTHLDKGHIWPRAANPDGTFFGALKAVFADREANWSIEDMRARFAFGLATSHAHGTVAIRTHLDTYFPHAPSTWGVFAELRDAWAGRIELQAASISTLDRFAGDEGPMIADLVAQHGGVLGMVSRLSGGVHDDLPPDFQPMLDRFFQLAEERGLALDLHIDESGETGARALREVALTAMRRNFPHPIQCGHCCSLALQPENFARETVQAVADAGISIIVLPMCNMYLQDRMPGRTPRWRGVTLVHELRAAGARVSVASDNCRDPFYAYGDHDMLEVYREATRILHFDHPFGDWHAAASLRPAEALGLPHRGRIAKGVPADLVLFSARFMTELLSRPQSDRVVLRGGRRLAAALPDWRELDPVVGLAPATSG